MAFDITNADERKRRIGTIKERARLLREVVRQKKGTPAHEKKLRVDLIELDRLMRVDRCENDVLLFMYTYFSDAENPINEQNLIPVGVTLNDAPDFHRELCATLNVVSSEEINKRICWAAPRGHAKSAYLSNCFPIHQIVYDKRKYILIISETDTAAKKFIEWVADQLKFNEKLRADFGEVLSPRKAMNDRDNQEAFLTMNGILVQASSMGKQLRGSRNGNARPDLVILDDLESSRNTNTAELREKNHDWLQKTIIPIGDPERTAIVYMGTMVHADGLLNHVLNRADFKSKKFAAIVDPPNREDLWEQFEEIIRNQDIPNRKEAALAFYEENEEAMKEGVRVLWDGRWSYVNLIMEKVNMGSKAFGSEFMNNPIDEESQIFKQSMFQFFEHGELKTKKLDIFMAWDLAMGKNNRSDYNAIVTIGRDPRTGIIYVLDAFAKKIPAHEALNVLVDKIKQYKPKICAVETVAFQADFYRQLRERLPKEKIYSTKLKAVVSRTKKEERIESLEPLFENGVIRLMRHMRLLMEQLESFPGGTNDDLPDATQMAVDLCARGGRRTYHKKPNGL